MTQDFAELFAIYADAAARRDVDRMMSIYDDGIVVFDAWDAWCASGSEAWRGATEDWLGSNEDDRIVVAFRDVRVLGEGDLMASHATVSFSALAGTGQVLRSMENRLTWVARLVDGRWRIVHQHTSVPITSTALTGVLSQASAA